MNSLGSIIFLFWLGYLFLFLFFNHWSWFLLNSFSWCGISLESWVWLAHIACYDQTSFRWTTLCRHFLYLLFVLNMASPFFIKGLFVHDGVFIKQPFGKSMILFFNTFSFLFTYEHVETLGTFLLRADNNRRISLLFSPGSSLNTTPFAAADFD